MPSLSAKPSGIRTSGIMSSEGSQKSSPITCASFEELKQDISEDKQNEEIDLFEIKDEEISLDATTDSQQDRSNSNLSKEDSFLSVVSPQAINASIFQIAPEKKSKKTDVITDWLLGYCVKCARTYRSAQGRHVTICVECVKPLRFRCVRCERSYRTPGIAKSHRCPIGSKCPETKRSDDPEEVADNGKEQNGLNQKMILIYFQK